MYIFGPYRMKALHTQEVRIPMPSRGICSAGDFYAWFTEGFDTADLQEAQALLDALA